MQETMCKRGETKMNEHEKLLEMSKPLIDYLKENYHPHTAIVVTEERVMVVETSVSVPNGQE